MNFSKKHLIYYFVFILYLHSFYPFLLENFLPFARYLRSYFLLFGDISLIALPLLSNSLFKKNFINYFLLLFLLTSSITFLINQDHIDILTHINGLREYLVIFCSLIYIRSVLLSQYASILHKLMIRFLIVFLIAQIPISTIQFLKYGAGDSVGGSLFMKGAGGSGTMTLIIYIGCFFLMTNNALKNNLKKFNLYYLLIIIPLFIPSFINETKISFVFMFLFFFFLLKFKIKNLIPSIFILITFYYFITFFSEAYVNTRNLKSIKKIASQEYVENYLYQDDPRSQSRFTKIVVAYKIINQDMSSLLFGKGMGIFKGGNVLQKSTFSLRYNRLLHGTRNYMFYLLIQGGIINSIIIILTILYPMINYIFYNKKKYNTFVVNKLYGFLLFSIIIIFLYSDAIRTGLFASFLNYVSLFILFSNNIYKLNSGNGKKFNVLKSL